MASLIRQPVSRIPAVATPTDVQRKTLRHLAGLFSMEAIAHFVAWFPGQNMVILHS